MMMACAQSVAKPFYNYQRDDGIFSELQKMLGLIYLCKITDFQAYINVEASKSDDVVTSF